MAINIDLSVNNSEDYALTKSITGTKTYSCILKDNCSVIDPEIMIATTDDLTQYNYIYISSFHRYYFIKQISLFPNGMYNILAHVDVLSSYTSEIKNCEAIIKRNEVRYNRMLDDPEYKTENDSDVVTRAFSTGSFSKTLNYVLATAGG